MQLTDDARHYGLVSRTLHWAMAALFAWQFAGMIAKNILGRVPLTGFWVGTHASVGTLLFLLVVLRLAWALAQRTQRPSYAAGMLGRLALLGHVAMYVLMAIVPALGIMRMIGGERPISLFGIAIRPAQAGDITWMTEPANLVHAPLAWLLLALILGHVGMVLLHRLFWQDDTLSRMAGRPISEGRA